MSAKIAIPEATIQEAIDGYFPLSSDDYADEALPVEVVITDGQAVLNEGSDRSGFLTHVQVTLPKAPAPRRQNSLVP